MDAWANFWGWLLIVVFSIFGILAIVITLGGFFDVKELFSTIDQQHENTKDGAST